MRLMLPVLLALAAATAAPASFAHGSGHAAAPLASAALMKGDASPAGVVSIIRGKGGVALDVALSGLPAGVHAIHLHTRGVCEVPGFASAGGHLNPGGHQHGRDNPRGAHMGDLPNITVAADGTARAIVPLAYAEADLIAALFDKDGGAVVVHAAPDDYKTDPTGNAGGRIACGAFVRG